MFGNAPPPYNTVWNSVPMSSFLPSFVNDRQQSAINFAPLLVQAQGGAPLQPPPRSDPSNIIINNAGGVVGRNADRRGLLFAARGGCCGCGSAATAVIVCPFCEVGCLVRRRNCGLFSVLFMLSLLAPPLSFLLCIVLCCTDYVYEIRCVACSYKSSRNF